MRAKAVWRLTTVLAMAFALLSGHAVVSATAPATSAGATAAAPDVFDVGLDPGHGDDPGLWLSWSLVDRSGNRRIGSPTSTTERTNAESSIKAWIAADYLGKAQDEERLLSPGELALMDRSILESDDVAAETIYRSIGRDEIFTDLDRTCGVHVATSRAFYWSYGQITADDATRILDCVLDRAPSYPDGGRLLDDLYHVDADGVFGIPDALGPDVPVAVKNGWTAHGDTGLWNVNCVAAWDHYTLAVLTRYPIGLGLDHGAGVCRDVTAVILRSLT